MSDPQIKTPEKTPMIVDDFEIMERIAGGAFSHVHIARHLPTGTYVAAKIVELSNLADDEFSGIMREISVFMQIQYPRICNLYHLSLYEEKLIFFIEYAQNGTLLSYVNATHGITEPEAKRIFIQIFDAIRYLHTTYFCVHRDLKLENILLDANNNVKVTDFGLASKSFNNRMHTFVGTPGFQAPEVLAGVDYDEKCDVWSLGVCLWAMLTDSLPFNTSDNFHSLVEEVECLEYPQSFSPGLVDILKKMFTIKPEIRPNLIQLQSHPWLRPLPSISSNITPSPIVFYNITSLDQISKFRRKSVIPNPTVTSVLISKFNLDEEAIKQLESDLKDGISSPNTRSYFCIKWPLLEKPTKPSWDKTLVTNTKLTASAQTPPKPPIIPGCKRSKLSGFHPSHTSNVALPLLNSRGKSSLSKRKERRYSCNSSPVISTLKSPIVKPVAKNSSKIVPYMK